MQLSTNSEYALRLLIHLYRNRRDLCDDITKKITLTELSKELNIGKNQLGKVTAKLVGEKILSSTHGWTGGLSISQKPNTVSVGQIVTMFDDAPKSVDCSKHDCPLLDKCSLNFNLDKAKQLYINYLNSVLIFDLANKDGQDQVLSFND